MNYIYIVYIIWAPPPVAQTTCLLVSTITIDMQVYHSHSHSLSGEVLHSHSPREEAAQESADLTLRSFPKIPHGFCSSTSPGVRFPGHLLLFPDQALSACRWVFFWNTKRALRPLSPRSSTPSSPLPTCSKKARSSSSWASPRDSVRSKHLDLERIGCSPIVDDHRV